jgi:hypothetical protein
MILIVSIRHWTGLDGKNHDIIAEYKISNRADNLHTERNKWVEIRVYLTVKGQSELMYR